MGNAQANGKAFLGLIRFIKDNGGEDLLKQIVKEAGPTTEKTFEKRIMVSSWYPYPAFTNFMDAIAKKVGRGEYQYCRKIGAIAGTRDLGTIFKIYKRIASAERLIKACRTIWADYYKNAGEMAAIKWSPDNTVLQITNFPEMTKNHCDLMLGWMARTMEELDFEILHCEERFCMSSGDSHHEFFYQWQKKR